MKTKLVALLILFFSLSITYPPYIFAQSNQLVDKTVKCLKNRPEDKGNSQSLTWHDPPTPQSLNKYLEGEFLPNSTVYPVACTGSGLGKRCGTGNAQLDSELFTGLTSLIQGGNSINVTFFDATTNQKITGGTPIDNTGVFKVNANVGGTAAATGAYDFFGVQVAQRVDNNITGLGALQQGVFDFLQLMSKDCAKLSWTHHDPYGIIFDSMSLEPLDNVVVTINDELGKPLEDNPVLRNNASTTSDGTYNYLVPPGKYILTLKPPTGYKFSATPKTNSNMSSVYDFIDENDAKSHCTIYKPGEIIDEKADMPECRNIPLEPVTVSPRSREPVSVLYTYEIDSEKNVYKITGKVSHPLSTVIVSQLIGTSQKVQLASTVANHSGYYPPLEIPLDKVLPDSPLSVSFVKSSFMGLASKTFSLPYIGSIIKDIVIKTALAQTAGQTTLSLDILPMYVEGYAFDSAQAIIPQATVQIKLKNGDGLYYETKADANGYFFIAPQNLPSSSLNLEFYINIVKPSGEKIPYKIYEFVKTNKYYYTKENINLLTGRKNGIEAVPQEPSKTKLDVVSLSQKDKEELQRKSNGVNTNMSAKTPEAEQVVLAQTKKNNAIMQQVVVIMIGILLLGTIAGIALAGMMKKKNIV